MTYPAQLYELNIITDSPIFEGFALVDYLPSQLGQDSLEDDITPGYLDAAEDLNWKQPRLSAVWPTPSVIGRVHPCNDFPGLDMALPAFSARACKCLESFLLPNGELLPLNSKVGEYFFYNITTIADVLNSQESVCEFWCDPPTTAVEIEHFAFDESKLGSLTIFRIPQFPMSAIVTDEFVDAVYANSLNGFEFTKIWPFERGQKWREMNQVLTAPRDLDAFVSSLDG
ncbi:hypothetical protein BVX99_01750 [bacterium F16]|nr:hypothetical protein BVX99_01750 [bacterium F16]